jgi:hypothetical protein
MGKKLKTHEIHLRRTENGYVAKHILRDHNGNPPDDGQRGEKEYNFDSLANLASHFAEHMPENAAPDEGEGEGEPQQMGG